MSFLIGIIMQSRGLLCIFYFTKMVNLIGGESPEYCTQLLKVPVKVRSRCIVIALNNQFLNGLMVLLHGQESCRKNCKTLKTSDPTWVSISCLQVFFFKSELVLKLIVVMTF